jgi:hypothetical protein
LTLALKTRRPTMSRTIPAFLVLLVAAQAPADDPTKPAAKSPALPLMKASGPKLPPDLPKTPSMAAAEAIVKEYDRNGDRMLNADEHPRLFRVSFTRLDGNRDGHLSVGELALGFEWGLARTVRRGETLANSVYVVADDFVVDVYHNGEKVPDSKRTLLEDVYGATVEKVDIEVREGDWVVFNVVNNRLRWGGRSYFAAAGMKANLGVGFVSETQSGSWVTCDEPGQVAEFIAYPVGLVRPARQIKEKWGQGDARMNGITDGWKGEAIWGDSRNTWIKYVAPAPRDEAKP